MKYFTGLQLLEVETITKPGSLDTRMNGLAQLSKNASGNGITNLVKILLGHRHVQRILIFEEWYVDLQECVKMARIGTSGPQATVTIIKDKRRGERSVILENPSSSNNEGTNSRAVDLLLASLAVRRQIAG